jgi:hypothetical protein
VTDMTDIEDQFRQIVEIVRVGNCRWVYELIANQKDTTVQYVNSFQRKQIDRLFRYFVSRLGRESSAFSSKRRTRIHKTTTKVI